MEDFVEILKDLVEEADLSLRQLAKDSGVSVMQLSQYLNGSTPTIEVTLKLATYFNCSLDYLFGISNEKEENKYKPGEYDISKFLGNYQKLLKANNLMFGEMIIVLNQKFAKNFILNQKQSMQLFSKTRYLSSQFLVMLEDELWRKNASHANNLALYLANKLEEMGFKITFPVQSNHVFVHLSDEQAKYLSQEYKITTYDFGSKTYRLMTSWCMKKEEVDEFLLYLKSFKLNAPLFNA